MTALSSTCRRDDCERPCTLLSVFCDEHHAEQLQRIGARIRTANDLLLRFWDIHCEGILSDSETVFSFFDHVSATTVVTEFDQLPSDYQSLITEFLRSTPPEALPRCSFVGDPSDEAIEAATAERRASAKVLQTHLNSQG